MASDLLAVRSDGRRREHPAFGPVPPRLAQVGSGGSSGTGEGESAEDQAGQPEYAADDGDGQSCGAGAVAGLGVRPATGTASTRPARQCPREERRRYQRGESPPTRRYPAPRTASPGSRSIRRWSATPAPGPNRSRRPASRAAARRPPGPRRTAPRCRRRVGADAAAVSAGTPDSPAWSSSRPGPRGSNPSSLALRTRMTARAALTTIHAV
jgi:hypothetical protein